MDDMVAWFRAQLDEDERIALAVEDRSAPWDGQWIPDGDNAVRTFNGHVLFYGHNGPLKPGLVNHVVEHDPARALREIEAKRQALDHYEAVRRHAMESEPYVLAGGAVAKQIKIMATPYDVRPGYKEEWRP